MIKNSHYSGGLVVQVWTIVDNDDNCDVYCDEVGIYLTGHYDLVQHVK